MTLKDKPAPVSNFWQFSCEEMFNKLSSVPVGLSTHDALMRIKIYGANTIQPNTRRSALFLLLSQFKSPVLLLLVIAAVLSVSLGDITDGMIVLVIIVLSGILSFWQERGAADAVASLLKTVQLYCRVFRDKQIQKISIHDIVPGDVVMLSAGDLLPADCLILSAEQLFVDEAAFTGETFPVEKNQGAVHGKRSNALFMGSHIISGKATALVVNTGTVTEFGQIASDLKKRIPETDFEKGIKRFGYLLIEITLILVIIIFAINVLLHKPVLNSFLFSLALAVGLTPQLLPAIISVNLSTGARQMAKLRVIVKRLSSIENFGSMDILCSDKTGTITEGKIKIKGSFGIDGEQNDKVFRYAFLNASLQSGFKNPIDDAICSNYHEKTGDYKVYSEVPYDFTRKRLTVQLKRNEEQLAITKGAFNSILTVCTHAETRSGDKPLLDNVKELIIQQYQQLSNEGFRTIGVAYKPTIGDSIFRREDEQGMIFLGFIALFDPPKPDVLKTLTKLNDLGVQFKIITGDNALVAKSLAVQIGFENPKLLTGPEIHQMSNAALLHKAPQTHIFAEVEPNQKERIIAALKKAGHVVGFMGDGINDAPALHIAEVGISVDTAVDIAKEAADIILLTKDLNVLTHGIIEGRKTFTNTMKYIFMATSANFGNMFSMAGASLFLSFLPLLPKQILLTNLLTDFPEMAIATDHVDNESIRLPQRWDLRFIKRFMITFGLLSSVFDFLTFGVLLLVLHADESVFQTGWFTESVISAAFIVLIVRTRLPFFKSLPGKYLLAATASIALLVLILPFTPMAIWFGFEVPHAVYYLWIGGIIAGYALAAEITKHWFYRIVTKKMMPAKRLSSHQ